MHSVTDLSRSCLVALRAVAVAVLLAAGARAGGEDVVKEGQWTKHDIPKGWALLETDHYQIQCQIGEANAKQLGAHLESMLKCYADFLPTRRKLEGFILKVFKDKAGYCKYSNLPPDTKAVAFYRQDTKELVGYDCGFVLGKRTTPPLLALSPAASGRLTDKDKARLAQLFDTGTNQYTFDLANVLSHEGWHEYFHFFMVSIVPMPSWLDEGLGDYFFMAEKDPEAKTAGYRLGDLNLGRFRAVRRAIEDGKTVSFEKLMGFEQDDYYSDPGTFYAQGWSMVQFLMQSKDAERRELIPKLIHDLKDTKNFRKSTEKTFKGIDLVALDKEYVGWLLAQPFSDPILDAVHEFGDRVGKADLTGDPRLIGLYDWYVKHPKFPGGDDAKAAPPPPGPPVLKPPEPPAGKS